MPNGGSREAQNHKDEKTSTQFLAGAVPVPGSAIVFANVGG